MIIIGCLVSTEKRFLRIAGHFWVFESVAKLAKKKKNRKKQQPKTPKNIKHDKNIVNNELVYISSQQ